jgi:hypothetical protein
MSRRAGRDTPRPSVRQYGILRHWAANTTEPGPPPGQRLGPAPAMQERTWHLLYERDWLRRVPHDEGLWVPDAGRFAAGLPPVGRDRSCPVCDVIPGARCLDLTRQPTKVAGMLAWTRTDTPHAARGTPRPFERLDSDLERRLTALSPHGGGMVGYIIAT